MPGGAVTAASLALFGKLPAHGDFVRRGDPGLASRLEVWLGSEVDRRFAATGAVPEPDPCWFGAGDGRVVAIVASRDGVGRSYPLAVVAGGVAEPARLVEALAQARDAGDDADALHLRLRALAGGPAEAAGEGADISAVPQPPDPVGPGGWPDEAAVDRCRATVADARV